MLILFGRRVARIGKFLDHDHICFPCKAYEREVRVYRPYFHFCFIPVFPIGARQFEIRCRNCGDETRTESLIKKYEKRARTPFYLYSALILAGAITAYWFYWNANNQKNNAAYIANPKVGDVYTIREDRNIGKAYSFFRIAAISGDTLKVLKSHLEYNYFVNGMAGDDYFVKGDTTEFTKSQLNEMLEQGGIYTIKRNYGDGGGFNRIR